MIITDIAKVFIPSAIAFFIGILITPFFSYYFYKFKLWKKKSRSIDGQILSDQISENFKKIHNEKEELNTPRVGGIIIWVSVFLTIFLVFIFSKIFPNLFTLKLDFLSRNQTFIPLMALLIGAILGLLDDLLQIFATSNYARDNIFNRWLKIGIIIFVGFLIGSWFYFKLGQSAIHIPFGGELNLGIFFIPFFILVMLSVFSSGIIDGLDGLAGGVLAIIFAAYSVIAFFNGQIDLATFLAVITGGILAFLWFNIPPARFYMGETGMMALTIVLSTVAFLTDSVLLLPIIALPLVFTTLSALIQIIAKKYFHRKVFRVAPLHHHFESLGWPTYKVTMRYWVISIIFSVIGVIMFFID